MTMIRLQNGILLFGFMVCGLLNKGLCQHTGRTVRTHFRGPLSIAHGRFRGRTGFSPFSRVNPATSSRFHTVNNGAPNANSVQGITVHPRFQHRSQSSGHSGTNSRPSFNLAHSVLFHGQNVSPNRTRYNTINNSGALNSRSRTVVHNIPSIRSNNPGQTRAFPHGNFQQRIASHGNHRHTIASHGNHQNRIVARGNHLNVIPTRGNHQITVSNQRFPPQRRTAFGRRPRSRGRKMSSVEGRSSGHGTHTQVQTAPVRASQISSANQVSERQRIARPHHLPAHRTSSRVPAPTSTGSNPFQPAQNSLHPAYRFRGERNEAFQHRTSITRSPSPLRMGPHRHFTGNAIGSLTLPFEPLSLRYRDLRKSERVNQERAANISSRPIQTGSNFAGNSRSFQTGTGLRRGPVHQNGLQFGGSSVQQNSRVNDARFRGSAHGLTGTRQIQRGITANRRNVPPIGRSLHEILGISTSGLQDAVRTARRTELRNNRPMSNNVQVIIRSQPSRRRIGIHNNDPQGRNIQDQTKAKLISDIRRTLNVADRLNLFRRRQLRNNARTNNRGRNVHPHRPVVIATGTKEDEDDMSINDVDDGFIKAFISSGDAFSRQTAEIYTEDRSNFIDEDEDEEKLFITS